MYCKNCKKHSSNTSPKKLALVSKNKIKENQNMLFVWLKGLLFIKLKEICSRKRIRNLSSVFLLTDVIKEHEDLLSEK